MHRARLVKRRRVDVSGHAHSVNEAREFHKLFVIAANSYVFFHLKQGATYADLNDLERGEFTATGDMTAGPNNYYVAKDDVHYNLWNLLTAFRSLSD